MQPLLSRRMSHRPSMTQHMRTSSVWEHWRRCTFPRSRRVGKCCCFSVRSLATLEIEWRKGKVTHTRCNTCLWTGMWRSGCCRCRTELCHPDYRDCERRNKSTAPTVSGSVSLRKGVLEAIYDSRSSSNAGDACALIDC